MACRARLSAAIAMLRSGDMGFVERTGEAAAGTVARSAPAGHPGRESSLSTPDITLIGSWPPPHGGQAVLIGNLQRYLGTQGLQVRGFNTGKDKSIRTQDVASVGSSAALLKALLRAPRS